MNTISRVITGLLAMVLGLFLIIMGLKESWVLMGEGVFVIVIGVVIVLNKGEDNIEKINKPKT